MTLRDERASSQLLQLAARYIAEEAGRETLITPTRVQYGNDKKHATIFVSVYPASDRFHALEFLARHRDAFRAYIKQKGRFSILPFIAFAFDEGEYHRQHIDELSENL